MKCIYFVQYFPPEQSSGSYLVLDLLECFCMQGWEVDVFAPTPTRGVTKEQRKQYCDNRIETKFDGKLTINRMPLYKETKGFYSRTIRYLLFSVMCLYKALTVPADFIFTGSGPPTQGFIAGIASKLTGKKIIYNLQDIFPDSLITTGISEENSLLVKLGRFIEKYTYKNSDLIITVSEDMKKNIIEKGVPESKVVVIRNWVDTEKVCPIPREENTLFDELGIKRENFYIVYAGNIGSAQGLDVLVNAAALTRNVKEIKYVIFGNGSEEDEIRQMIERMQLDNFDVYPLQPIERVSEVYSLGDIDVITCRPGVGNGGMPSKLWSIMATGTPVVASFDKCGEMETILTESNGGICVPAGDYKALSDTILDLYQNRALLNSMKNNGIEYTLRNASKKMCPKEYIKEITRIVNDISAIRKENLC